MDSEYDYVISERALSDINEIISYLSDSLLNSQAAKAFYYELLEAINRIAAFPESGSPVMNIYLQRTDIRSVNVKNYSMYYVPDSNEKKVNILRVIYSRRNVTEILRSLGQ